MLSLPSRTKLFLCTEPVDMRKCFDGLFGIVKQQLQLNPLSGHLFLTLELEAHELAMILRGIDLKSARRRIRYERSAAV